VCVAAKWGGRRGNVKKKSSRNPANNLPLCRVISLELGAKQG